MSADARAADAEDYKGLFDGGLGFGQKSAVIVVDFTKAYTTPGSKLYCPGEGFGVVDAVAAARPLVDLARSRGVPLFYTIVQYDHPADGGLFARKVPLLHTLTKDNPLIQIDEDIAPRAGDCVLVKQYPSAFFGTNLASSLRSMCVDTCIVVGCSTSGCIRATVLDGMQRGFRCIVPRECVGDRTEGVHEANLFDMNAKNGDVVPKSVVMEYLSALPLAATPSEETEAVAKRARFADAPTEKAVAASRADAEDGAASYRGVFDGCLGFGRKSAVVVVDFTKAYTTAGSKWYCPGKGYGVVDAVAESRPLLELARSKGVPVFYTVVYFEHPTDGGIFTQKIPLLRTWTKDNPLVQIDNSISPQASDSVLVKQYPSAFFGTCLASSLHAIGVDTCIVVGCSTSGCIRATVLDGVQLGFRCIVPRECVGDRTENIHAANLFDINAKLGDVVPKSMVMKYLGKL